MSVINYDTSTYSKWDNYRQPYFDHGDWVWCNLQHNQFFPYCLWRCVDGGSLFHVHPTFLAFTICYFNKPFDILTIIVGVLIEFLVYKLLHEKRASHGIYLISSLGVYILMINIIALIFGNETKLLSFEIGTSVHLGEIILTKIQVIQFFTFLILAILSVFFMHYTRIGKTIQAMGCNARLLEFSGVNLRKMRFIVFAIGSFFASIAAILTGLDVGIDPYMGMMPLLNAVTAVIPDGIKRIEGTIAGAFFIITGLVIYFKYSLYKSPFCTVLKAIREEEQAVISMGKNVVRFKILAFAISSGVAAIAGGLYAGHITYIDPTSFTLDESIFILAICPHRWCG
ncbi:MAG: ABC transporter permease [Candidatus Brocadiaceae bacterium]